MMQDDDDVCVGEDSTKRTERKRQREKQRRFDLTNAFDELATVLSRIEPEDAEVLSGKKKKRRSSVGDGTEQGEGTSQEASGAGETTGMTRLDLVVRTIDMLKKLQSQNSELKNGTSHEKEEGDQEVLVMVPTLTPAVESAQHLPTSYPAAYFQQQAPTQRSPQLPSQQTPQPRQQPYHQPYLHPYQPPYHHPYQQPFQGPEQSQSAPQHPNYSTPSAPYYSGPLPSQGYGYAQSWGDQPHPYGQHPGPSMPEQQQRAHGNVSTMQGKHEGDHRNSRDEGDEHQQNRH